MSGRGKRHLPDESDPNRPKKVGPDIVFAEPTAGISVQLFEVESGFIGVDDQGGTDLRVEVRGQDDDGCPAMDIVMQLDRPTRPEFGDDRGDLPVPPRPQGLRVACRRLSPADFGVSHQHRRIPLVAVNRALSMIILF